MGQGVSRREFLKYSAATGVLIAVGERMVDFAMAEGAPRLVEADRVTVWVLVDNYYDALRPDSPITKRYRVVPGKSIHAEHGISFFVESVVDGQPSACMFDFGLDAAGVMNNLALLGIDLGKAKAFSLSHGHYDHYLASRAVLQQSRSQIPAGTPFFVGEEAFAQRYSVRPGASEPADLGRLAQGDIEAIGLKVVEVKNPTQVIPGGYLTGNIERVTTYEKVPPSLLVKRGEKTEPDDFRGEQALFFNVKGKGLVVLSGCAHAGIVNTVRQAQKASGVDRVHAVMGGFHLINAKPEVIQSTVADIKALKPDYVVPAHCTGFEAILAFRNEMPEAFTINTAGTRYTFGA
ncbi:MAG TPA: MBL fold metallo-hydrolase [Candidatus Methanoperedens sp.]|nr:MBL fold metallo-hydrolase [Candidatus Methanoperedens sp.]